jgi:hypothetical protein
MSMKKVGLAAAGAVVAGGIVLGGAALANAAPGTPSPTASSAPSGPGTPSGSSTDGHAAPAHNAVTGDELAKVTAAVKAKDSSITVSSVTKDADGSYDVFGTKNGSQVKYDVSTDLTTFTQSDGGRGGDGRGGGGPAGTPVTGDELAKVTAAVKAKDSSITVSSVTKDADGSYDVFGTKNGSQVKYDVSTDLTTFTQDTAGPGR